MKAITEEVVQAFIGNYSFMKSNTEVTTGANREMKLHGNTIARVNRGDFEISHCGYTTVTTKERLNGLLTTLNAPTLYQRDYNWYYTDREGVRCPYESTVQSNGFISLSYLI